MELNVEELFRRLQPVVVPTEPGTYLDSEGDMWVLRENGEWMDTTGETRPASYNWMLVGIGPFYPVSLEGMPVR